MTDKYIILVNGEASGHIFMEEQFVTSYEAEAGCTLQKITTEEVSVTAPTTNLAQTSVRETFQTNVTQPIEHPTGVFWDAGKESISALLTVLQLAQLAGEPTVTFYDTSNIAHILTIQEALEVINLLNTTYQEHLAVKQTALINLQETQV